MLDPINVSRHWAFLFTSQLPGTFVATTSQFPNQILGGLFHVFRNYIPVGRRVGRLAFSDIRKDLVIDTHPSTAHCFGPAPQEWEDPAEEKAEKFADPVSSLNAQRCRVHETDPRSS